jgi:peptide/nickel transport system ATP-binding protein
VVRAIADRVLVMYLGCVVESGSVQAIFRAPGHPYTRALLAATPVVNPGRRQVPREVLRREIPSPLDPPPGCRFHPRCQMAQDVCRTTVPPMMQIGDGGYAACHFAGQVPPWLR